MSGRTSTSAPLTSRRAAVPPLSAAIGSFRPARTNRLTEAASAILITACALAAAACVRQPGMSIEQAPVLAPCRQLIAPSFPHVTWIGPAESRDRERLDRWCNAVGPIVGDPVPQIPPSASDAVTVVVWNVHVGGGDLDRLIGALMRGELTGAASPASFVLLLQEVYRGDADVPARPPLGSAGPRPIVEQPPQGVRRSALDVARAHGLAIVYVPSMRNAGLRDASANLEDRGNAIVSTWPIQDPVAIELPFERQRRVALAATISGWTTSGAAWRLRVASAHLDTTLALTRGGPLAARHRQAAALVDALNDSSPLPTLVGGDFNTWFGNSEPAIGVLRRAFPQTPTESFGATWRGPLRLRAALDHVFARDLPGTVSVRRVSDRFGSDHYPLIALVGIRPHGADRDARN